MTSNECDYKCPLNFYFSNNGTCFTPLQCYANNQFADNATLSCVSVCQGSFGDSSSKYCI
jgi:hypothetical protein